MRLSHAVKVAVCKALVALRAHDVATKQGALGSTVAWNNGLSRAEEIARRAGFPSREALERFAAKHNLHNKQR